jgi:hypothetical protein
MKSFKPPATVLDRRKFNVMVAGSLGAALVLGGCVDGDPTTSSAPAAGGGSTEEAMIEAAKKEGGMVLYASMSPGLIQPLLDDFKKAYDLEVELVQISAQQLSTRFAAEMESGRPGADVLQISGLPFVKECEGKGWFVASAQESRLQVPVGGLPEVAQDHHRRRPASLHIGSGTTSRTVGSGTVRSRSLK